MIPLLQLRTLAAIPFGLVALAGIASHFSQADPKSKEWNPKLAAVYLDSRTLAWKSGGAMDHGSFCVSCHTALPFALARPGLGKSIRETDTSPVERLLLESVTTRVKLSKEVQPYLGDKVGGFGTETVLNALVLARKSADHGRLDSTTKTALQNMWTTQIKSGERAGSWPWISAGNEPWEAPDSYYWGATLAAIAAGTAPNGYLSSPQIKGDLQLLKKFLQKNEKGNSLFNRLGVLEASTTIPDLISRPVQSAIIADALAKQQPDGGWSTYSLIPADWARHDRTKQETKSDGYGTGLVALTLEQAGLPRSAAPMRRALKWLSENQDAATGSWPTVSPNVTRDPSTDVGKFMTDAATAYAVMALSNHGTPL